MVEALSVQGLSRSFGRVRALAEVSLEVAQGEIHAVVGGNGAGKSTLMSVLSGQILPDSGCVRMLGRDLPLGRQQEIRKLGLAMVHQHFMLASQMTVLENLVLDQMGSLQGVTRPQEVKKKADAIADSIGWKLPYSALAGELAVGAQQRVEIIKALCSHPKILILDEPTAVLSPQEVQELIRVLKALKNQGATILLIAHKLSEVYEAADRVTVLRQGRNAGSGHLSEIPPSLLATWMLGESPLPLSSAPPSGGEVLLEGQGISVLGDRGEVAVSQADLTVKRGEILGIGGVDGNGQTELAEALAGSRPFFGGKLSMAERPGFIPPDRQADGLALRFSVLDNMLIAGIDSPELAPRGWLLPKKAREWGAKLVAGYSIKVDSLDSPISSLSGGNQQKVIVSRVLNRQPKLVIAVNPTRGLDLGAARFVHEELIKAAGRGAGVILFSTDREELAALAHKTMTMSRGVLSEAGDDLTAGLLAGVVT